MKITVNGIELYYEKSGSGAPLIMLHGNGETHEIFDKAIPLLSEHFTVYAIDSRGHGQSATPAEYHYADMCEDVYQFIEALELQSPVLYGFSDGGIIGLLLECQHHGLLSRLIVSGANTRPAGIRDGWLKFFKFLAPLVKDPKMSMMLSEPDITEGMLRSITVPTLVLAGTHDLVKRSDTLFIANSIPCSTLQLQKRQGHGSYIVHSKKIARLILDFCK